MRLRKRGFVMFGTTMAVGALLGACTPEPPQTGPTPASTPTPISTTPTESVVEREQRLDFEAAEKAYRANSAEQSRLYRRGGASRATAALKATSTGEYLKFTTEDLRAIKSAKRRVVGEELPVTVDRTAWKVDRVILTACEDGTGLRVVDKKRHDVTPAGSPFFVQTLTVLHMRGSWRVGQFESKRVKTFKGELCDAG